MASRALGALFVVWQRQLLTFHGHFTFAGGGHAHFPRLSELLACDSCQPQSAASSGCMLSLLSTNGCLRHTVLPLVTEVQLLHKSDISVLAECNWQQLQKLNLSGIRLDRHCYVQLAQADLPLLTSLDLTRSHRFAACVDAWNEANWPLLASLSISDTCMTKAALRLLLRNRPALRHLLLQHVDFFSDNHKQDMVQPSCPQLQTLSLTGSRMDSDMISWLSSMHCSQLQTLQLA